MSQLCIRIESEFTHTHTHTHTHSIGRVFEKNMNMNDVLMLSIPLREDLMCQFPPSLVR